MAASCHLPSNRQMNRIEQDAYRVFVLEPLARFGRFRAEAVVVHGEVLVVDPLFDGGFRRETHRKRRLDLCPVVTGE